MRSKVAGVRPKTSPVALLALRMCYVREGFRRNSGAPSAGLGVSLRLWDHGEDHCVLRGVRSPDWPETRKRHVRPGDVASFWRLTDCGTSSKGKRKEIKRPCKEDPILPNSYWSASSKHLFVCFLPVLGLHCCVGSSLVAMRGGYSLIVLYRLPTAVASLTAEHGLWDTQASEVAAPGLQTTSSVVVTQGLSCPAACGIFSDHRSNWHPLRCKADSWNTREAWTTREALLPKLLNLIFAFMYTLPFFLKCWYLSSCT